MLKGPVEKLKKLEADYPGILETVLRFEAMEIPSCFYCKSGDTALVQAGIIGRTIALTGITTKFKLVASQEGRPAYYCNNCRRYFGPSPGRL